MHRNHNFFPLKIFRGRSLQRPSYGAKHSVFVVQTYGHVQTCLYSSGCVWYDCHTWWACPLRIFQNQILSTFLNLRILMRLYAKVASHAFEWVWPSSALRLRPLRQTGPNSNTGRNGALVPLIERRIHLLEPEIEIKIVTKLF